MRLLELQRGALGLPAQERLAWESRGSGETGLPLPEVSAAAGRGAVLAVEVTAFPSDGVIVGAVVTFGISIANEGSAPAAEISVGAPLPGGASYRPGTFAWNGRSAYDDVAEKLFGAGLEIGGLSPGERATFAWKVGVRLGAKPLIVAPSVRAPGSAVVGARPAIVSRREQPESAFAGELARADATVYEPKPLIPVEIPASELPIYELDEEEQLIAEAAEAALSSAAPMHPVRAPEPEPPRAQAPIAEPEPQPIEPEPQPIEPEPQPTQAIPLPPEPVPVAEGVVLYGRFDRATLAFFERVFLGGKAPTLLQHCILGGALACPLDASGLDAAGLKVHLDAQSQVLHRIALHEKLGKKEPISEYPGELLARLEALTPRPLPAPPATKDAVTLATELSEATLELMRRIDQERARWDFVKARQLTLALQAERAVGVGAAVEARLDVALRAYAQASVSMLQKLFVRLRIDRTTAVLSQSDTALDAAARALLSAVKLALP
ncbi:MAG TPA: hypothetical protein VMH02_08145 [Verrucomicrobiae bacterium]|nr:hypothetical protein [Verrucomicrobiae bacterium]